MKTRNKTEAGAMAAAPRAERTYPVVVASGTYREIGEQIGAAAGESIRALCQMHADDDKLPGAAAVSCEAAVAAARAECPDLLAEIEGMSVSAGVSVEALIRLNGGGAAMPWQGEAPEAGGGEPEGGGLGQQGATETGGCTYVLHTSNSHHTISGDISERLR